MGGRDGPAERACVCTMGSNVANDCACQAIVAAAPKAEAVATVSAAGSGATPTTGRDLFQRVVNRLGSTAERSHRLELAARDPQTTRAAPPAPRPTPTAPATIRAPPARTVATTGARGTPAAAWARRAAGLATATTATAAATIGVTDSEANRTGSLAAIFSSSVVTDAMTLYNVCMSVNLHRVYSPLRERLDASNRPQSLPRLARVLYRTHELLVEMEAIAGMRRRSATVCACVPVCIHARVCLCVCMYVCVVQIAAFIRSALRESQPADADTARYVHTCHRAGSLRAVNAARTRVGPGSQAAAFLPLGHT
jgi:hypothetical protein